jgi:hypothetical protein
MLALFFKKEYGFRKKQEGRCALKSTYHPGVSTASPTDLKIK